MLQTLGPAPGIESQHPPRITIEKATATLSASIGGLLLAESESALILSEGNYSPVIYFPSADVFTERLDSVDIRTSCPFKGEASYFRLVSEPRGDVVAWTYPNTYDDVASIRGYIAFYSDRVTLSEIPKSN
jgi:uncharacterized protein (DUF427 family)